MVWQLLLDGEAKARSTSTPADLRLVRYEQPLADNPGSEPTGFGFDIYQSTAFSSSPRGMLRHRDALHVDARKSHRIEPKNLQEYHRLLCTDAKTLSAKSFKKGESFFSVLTYCNLKKNLFGRLCLGPFPASILGCSRTR